MGSYNAIKAAYNASGSAALNDAFFSNTDEAEMGRRLDIVGGLSAANAYRTVPWINRAVDMVASAIAAMPYDLNNAAGDDVKDAPANTELLAEMTRNLYMVASSLWLTGAAYLIPESNAAGRGIKLRFVRTRFMQPIVTGGELSGFMYRDRSNFAASAHSYKLEEVIYLWMPNMDSAVAPGPAPVAVALGAASVLLAITSLESAFFNGGGVPVTLVELPGGAMPADKEDFSNFLNKRAGGVWNAFKYLLVRFGVKPTVLGSPMKDLQAPELTKSERDNIAVGLRVPPSVISGEVKDVNNNRADKAFFYDNTIIPVFNMIAEGLNAQLFETRLAKPLTLAPAPERLPIMQEIMLDTGKALELLTGRPVFKVDEAREIMGLDKWGEGDPDTAPAAPAPVVHVAAPGVPATAAPPSVAEKPAASPAGAPVVTPPAKASVQFEQMVKHYAERRRVAVSDPGQAVGLPFDDELLACKTAGEVRAVFERHWPVKAAAEPSVAEVLAELKRFNDYAAGAH